MNLHFSNIDIGLFTFYTVIILAALITLFTTHRQEHH